MATRYWLAATLAGTALTTQISCAQLECGEGTIERGGSCVPADGVRPENDHCAAGTHYDDAEGGCVPDLEPTVCGENTSERTDPDTGYTICEGTGVVGCGLPCPDPTSGNVTLCGQLYDVETDEPITDGVADGTRCDPANPTATGPCSLKIDFFPALPFAQNPTTTPPLIPANFVLNNCGRFAAEDIEEPELGYMGIGVDDHEDSGNDNYVLAGVALPAAAGLQDGTLVVYAVKKSTDAAWTASAGDPFSGTSFGTRGAYVPIFLHGDGAPDSGSPAMPIAGVTVTENGANEAANTYYFTDTDPHTRLAPDVAAGAAGGSQDVTGANGSALKVNSLLVNHSGTGNEPNGCEWPSDLAASIMGVTFVQRRIAETAGTDENCP